MIESVIDLKREVQNALKRIGKADLCLHEDELDFLSELATFLKPFKELSDLFSLSIPTLSTIPLMKARIRNLCTVAHTDDEKMKLIKQAVLRKLDIRFPVTDIVKLHQLLDPETKGLIPRTEAAAILEGAVQSAIDKGFMTFTNNMQQPVIQSNDHEEEEADLKRKRIRMELMNELKREVRWEGMDLGNEVSFSQFPYITGCGMCYGHA